MKSFDLVVLGGGPGGYVAAIRASQLGKSVAIVEMDKLGGVCLNRGCIPTKALLKSAHSVHELKDLKGLGINIDMSSVELDPAVAIKRAERISSQVSKGIDFLMKKNKIEVIKGKGKLKSPTVIEVNIGDGESLELEAKNIVLATGAHYKTFPGLEHDGENIIGAWEALKMEELPKSIGIIGAGAIGVEFAYFWNAFGVDVHIFEVQDHLLPFEDTDSSFEIERAYKRLKIKQSLGIGSVSVKKLDDGVVVIADDKEFAFEKCMVAVGMTGNVEGLGLSEVGVEVEKGFIKVEGNQETSIKGIYAIGDVSGGALLAHAASHEGIVAVESISRVKTHPVEIKNIAGCTYCQPQVASIGYTERALQKDEIEYTVGKMPFRANGKGIASNEKDGFVKVLLDKDGKLLGAHIVGNNATELIHEFALFKSMNGSIEDMLKAIHPHPTLGEWIPEAMMAAKDRALHA